MRGNIGAEIAGLMDSLDISHTFVVPALPSYGRTTLNGNVYVKGILLEETEFANDPKNPIRESYIPGIIAHQTDKRTALICFNDLLAGKLQFINKLEILIHEGVQIIIIDAEENEDLDLVASILSQRKIPCPPKEGCLSKKDDHFPTQAILQPLTQAIFISIE